MTPLKSLGLFSVLLLSCISAQAAVYVTIVQGLGGQPEWDERFTEQFGKIRDASHSLADEDQVTDFSGPDATRENLLAHFRILSESMTSEDRAVIYLIGHGSYDGEQYKFNIPGPDITDGDLAEILGTLPGKNHFLLNTSSASGATLEALETDDRILVTATRNGNEKNATEFGDYFAEALVNENADINKNSNISIQEAFDYANRGVENFFESQSKLATEHAQIRSDTAASFTLARLGDLQISSEDPRINELLTRRQELDQDIEELQLRRNEFTNADYIQQLQALILQAAEVSEELEQLQAGSGDDADRE